MRGTQLITRDLCTEIQVESFGSQKALLVTSIVCILGEHARGAYNLVENKTHVEKSVFCELDHLYLNTKYISCQSVREATEP